MLVSNYLFKNLLKTAIFITAAITMVVLLTQSLKLLELVTNTAAPSYLFSKMFILTLPKLFETLLPVSLAITILFVYNRMIMDNEIVVMRACGFSQKQLAMPALVLGSASVAILLLFSIWLTPLTVNEVKGLKFDARTKYASFFLKEGVFNTFSDNFTVYIRKKDHNGDMYGIMIHDTRDKDKLPVTITAKKGAVATDGEYPMLYVYDGMRQQVDEKNGSLSKLYFGKYSIEVKGLNGEVKQRWRKEDERTFGELFHPNKDDERDVSSGNLFMSEVHRRLVTPWNALSFTVVAASAILFGAFNRKGQVKKIILGAFLVCLLQGFSVVFTNLSKDHNWAVILLYANVAVPIAAGFYSLSPAGEKTFTALLSVMARQRNKRLLEEEK